MTRCMYQCAEVKQCKPHHVPVLCMAQSIILVWFIEAENGRAGCYCWRTRWKEPGGTWGVGARRGDN
jgi:hypothetical protein